MEAFASWLAVGIVVHLLVRQQGRLLFRLDAPVAFLVDELGVIAREVAQSSEEILSLAREAEVRG